MARSRGIVPVTSVSKAVHEQRSWVSRDVAAGYGSARPLANDEICLTPGTQLQVTLRDAHQVRVRPISQYEAMLERFDSASPRNTREEANANRESVPVTTTAAGRTTLTCLRDAFVVCQTTDVKLRGPERSEGHVSFNIRVMRLSSLLSHSDRVPTDPDVDLNQTRCPSVDDSLTPTPLPGSCDCMMGERS
jgi:hypothetical protein